MVETIAMYGDKTAQAGMDTVQSLDFAEQISGDNEKQDAQLTLESNKFLEKVMGEMQQQNSPEGQKQKQEMPSQDSGNMI